MERVFKTCANEIRQDSCRHGAHERGGVEQGHNRGRRAVVAVPPARASSESADFAWMQKRPPVSLWARSATEKHRGWRWVTQ